MDFFEHRYYRLGKILMSLTGQWPYQSTRTKCILSVVLILPMIHQVASQMLAVVKYRNHSNILLESLIPSVFNAVCATKYLSMNNSQKTLKLLSRIRTDWQLWARHREVKILHEYAEWGEKINTVYTAGLYLGMLLFATQPMTAKLIDDVLKNGTTPGTFPYPVIYYPLDMEKYYYCLNIYCALCGLMVLTILISNDVMLILYVQHVCGIFSAVGHKLERIGCNDKSVETDMRYIVSCIDGHNDALEYANLIKASYAWNFFFTIVFGMILLVMSALQIVTKTSDFGTTMQFIAVMLGATFYFYIECYIAQILIDHSIRIRFYIYNNQWYRLPLKAQKLLQFMTMRCNARTQLTVGNMLAMSVETFGLVLRTFLSYFACASSMQG